MEQRMFDALPDERARLVVFERELMLVENELDAESAKLGPKLAQAILARRHIDEYIGIIDGLNSVVAGEEA